MSETAPEATPETPAETPAEQEPDWKAEARKWERQSKANKAKLDEYAPKIAEYDTLKAASQSELEKANETATNLQTRTERLQRTAVATTVRALAVEDFADPTDAVSALDPTKYLGLEDEIDEAAIVADLAALLEAKPHYRKPEGAPTTRVPAPNTAQGKGANPVATDPKDLFAQTLRQAMAQQ